MRESNDPIQNFDEKRIGLNVLIEEKKQNNEYYDEDLHDCSNDLSDRGNIRENIAHAEFMKRKKAAMLKNRYANYGRKYKNKDSVKIIFAVICFIIFIIIEVIDAMNKLENTYFDNSYPESNVSDYTISEDFEIGNTLEYYEIEFDELKENFKIDTLKLKNSKLIYEIKNENDVTINNVNIQTIFYDAENRPIKICTNDIQTLFKYGKVFCTIEDAPESYTRYDYLITRPYYYDKETNIEYDDLAITAVENTRTGIKFEVTNNSSEKIEMLEVAVLYYYQGKIVDIEYGNVWDIRAGKKQEGETYNWSERPTYDSVEMIVNDIL